MMQNSQIRLTLPVQLRGLLQAKASKYGLSLSAYIKNLIVDDVKHVEYPVFEASESTEQAYKKAIDERRKAVEVDDVGDFFDKL
jgi:hypothetical protein